LEKANQLGPPPGSTRGGQEVLGEKDSEKTYCGRKPRWEKKKRRRTKVDSQKLNVRRAPNGKATISTE